MSRAGVNLDDLYDQVVGRAGAAPPKAAGTDLDALYDQVMRDESSPPVRAVGVPGSISLGPGKGHVDPGEPGYERLQRGAFHPTLKKMLMPGEAGYEDAVNFGKMVAANHPAPPEPFESPSTLSGVGRMIGDAITEPDTASRFVSGLNAGRLGYASGAASVMGTVADLTGNSATADAFRQAADQLQEDSIPGQTTAAGRLGTTAWDSVPSLAMILAARGQGAGQVGGLVSRMASGATLGAMGVASAGQGIKQYRDAVISRGEDPDPKTEALIGSLYATAEIAFERVGIEATGEILHEAAGEIADAMMRGNAAGFANFLLSSAKAAGVNATEEGATQVAQNLIDRMYDPGRDLDEGVAQSAIGGALQGLGMAGGAGISGVSGLVTRPTREPAHQTQAPTPSPAPGSPQAPAGSPQNPVVAQAIRDAEARLRARFSGQSDADIKAKIEDMPPDQKASLRDELGLGALVNKEDQAAADAVTPDRRAAMLKEVGLGGPQTAPATRPGSATPSQARPARGGSTLAELLAEATPGLAEQFAAGKITREEFVAALEAQIAADPLEKQRREFAAMGGVNDGRGATDEGGPLEGGVRRPDAGPREGGRGDGVDVAEDVRPLAGRVSPVVGGEGPQAGDQPGDVGVGRSAAEVAAERDSVAKFFRGRDDAEMRSVAHWVETGVDNPGGRNDAYAEFIKAAKAYPDEFESELQRRKIREPQQPGAVTAATQREGASNGQGQEEGRPQGLLTNEPAAPEQGSTGVFSPPPAGAEQSAPSVSPNLDSMSHDELKAYAKSIGVPPRGSPDGIRARIRKAQQQPATASNDQTRPGLPKGQTPEYDALPAVTREQFEAAYQARDVDAMAGYLHAGNKALRREFAARAGLDRMPPGVTRTRAAVEAWAQAPASSATASAPQATEASPRGSAKTQAPSASPAASTATTLAPSANQNQTTPQLSSGVKPSSGDATPNVASATPDVASGFLSALTPEERAELESLERQLYAKVRFEARSGIDPEIVSLGMRIGSLYFKAGSRKFADFARNLVARVGQEVKPYLKSIYMATVAAPGVDSKGADSLDAVARMSEADVEAATSTIKANTDGERLAERAGIPLDAVRRAKAEADAIPATININTPERDALRESVADKVYGDGAKVKGRKAFVILGISGGGKSTVANPILREHGAMLVDPDTAKPMLPEFAGGIGSTAVHAESAAIFEAVLARAIGSGDNVVIPRSGVSLEATRRFIDALRQNGYEINLRLVDLPAVEAARRTWERFKAGGQGFIDPQYLAATGDGPSRTYDALKKEAASYARFDNNVPRGESPKLIEEGSGANVVRGVRGDRGSGGDVGSEQGRDIASSQGDRPQDAQAAGEVGPSSTTPPRVKKFRDMADRLMAQAEALEKNSSRRFDSAPGAAVTGGSGRHRSGLHEKTNRAIEGSLDDLRKAKRLREAAGKWNSRADNLDPEVIRQREQRKAVVLEAREKVKAKESAERKAAPIINEDGEGVLRITADEWKKADKDYKGISVRGGVRVRTLLRGGSLHEVFITDMPVKTRAGSASEIGSGGVYRDEGDPSKMGLKDADGLRILIKTTKNGWRYQETPDGAVLVHPSENRAVRFRVTDERSGSQLLRARTEAQAYAQDNPVQAAATSAGDLVVKPIVGEEPKQPSAPLQRAREAKAAKTLDEKVLTRAGKQVTRRELVDSEIAEGATPQIVEVTDTAAVNEAQRRKQGMDRMEGGIGPPIGNPGHPDTIKYRALEETIKNPPKKPEYRMANGGSWRMLTKAEYDYAVTKKQDAGEQSAKKQNDPYAADIEKLTAILRKQVATETSPRRQGQAAIVVLNGEAPAVQEAVAKVLWEIAPEAAEFVASDGPIGVRGVVAKAKPQNATVSAKTPEKGDSESSDGNVEIGKYKVFAKNGKWSVNFLDQSGAIQGRSGLATREEAVALAEQWKAKDDENAAYRRQHYPMTLAEYPKVRDRIMSGDQTADEHKELARWLMRSESAIKAELGQKTLKQLAPNGTGGNTKASIIDIIYRNMLGRFHLGDSVSYNPFGGETYESALIKKIEATTDQDIQKFKADRQGRIDARKKALENPETLDEFRQFIEKNGEAALSVEQRKKYDELTAAVNKRMRGDDRPDYIAKVDTGGVQLTVKEGFHEKAKIPLWIVQMSGRVDSDAYKALVEAAKKLGGWWSSFKKESTGFQFKTKAAADEFVQINQKSITTETTDKAREESQAEKAAARLIAMADDKIDAAEAELGKERNSNTVRRARMAESAEASARKAKQMAETLANIAEGIQNGTAKALRGIRNMAQLEELERSLMLAQREYWYSMPEESRRAIDPSGNWWNLPMDENIIAKAVMPMPEPHKDHVRAIASAGMTTPGIKRESAKLDKLWRYSEKRNPDSPVVKIDNPYDFNAAKAVASRLKGAGAAKYAAESVYDALMHHQRVADMGIKSSAEMRVALREYMGFRVGQAQPDAVREMERGLIGKTVGIDFFPTPPALATEVVDKADIEPGMKVLEPSAGNGRIADAIKAAGVTPDVAEVSGDLRAILEKKGYPLEGRDFMEFNPGPVYDRIVMNPPFSNRMDVEHVRHAYDLLKPGGRIVAIMSEGPFFGQDRKASEFRDWLDTVGTSEQLTEGSFQSDKSGLPTTGVNARVVVIDKPQAGEKATTKITPQGRGNIAAAISMNGQAKQPYADVLSAFRHKPFMETAVELLRRNVDREPLLKVLGDERDLRGLATQWGVSDSGTIAEIALRMVEAAFDRAHVGAGETNATPPAQGSKGAGLGVSDEGGVASETANDSRQAKDDPLHDKVMAFRDRLNNAEKRSDLDGMEDEARMLADAADRAGRSDLITMARGFIGQVQEKSGRLASQEYRAKQEAKGATAHPLLGTDDSGRPIQASQLRLVNRSDGQGDQVGDAERGVITFPDMPTRSEELTREYAAMGYQGSGITKTLEEAQKRIKDNGIQADIAKERDGYRILRKYPGTPVLTLDQLASIRDVIDQRGGLGRIDANDVRSLNDGADPDIRYLLMRYIANQDVPRVWVEAKNTAHELMGDPPKQDATGPTAPIADTLRAKLQLEKDSRRAWARSTVNDAETKAKNRAEEERLKLAADAMAPQIVAATEAAIGEYGGDIPDQKAKMPAAGTPGALEVFRSHEQSNADMEGLWAEERELDREVASKKYGTKVREAAEKRREKLRETIAEAKAEWNKKRDAMIRMRQEHAWNGPDLWRKLGVMTSWYPGRYSEVAAYLTKAADFLVGTLSPELSTEDRGIVARDAVANFLESPLGDSLTNRIDQKLYVFTKKANQKAAIDRVNAASPLQSHERSKFIRDIENTDDKDAMDKIAAEAEAMAAERNAQEAEVERIQAEAEAKEKESNTAALTDPSKMRATTARQAMGKRALPPGSPVNGTNKLAVWTENIPAKLRSQIESLGEEPITVRGNALTSEAMARMADSLADKATVPATLLGAVGKDGEPFVLFAYGKDEVGAVNGKMWAFANTLGTGEWFTEESGGVLVLKVGGKPVVMVAGIKSEHVPPVDRVAALAKASAGWREASGPTPKTYLTPKSEAPSTPINEAAYPTLEDLGIKTEYASLVAKAEQATRDYHAALEVVSKVNNYANTSLTDEAILAKAKAMSGDDEPSNGFRSLAVDALIRENPDLKAAKDAAEAAQKAQIQAERAVESERHRAASAFKGEAEDKYREMVKGRKWWQHDAEASAIERLWRDDPRIAVLREMAGDASTSREIDTTGEILPPDFKPGVGIGYKGEPNVDMTTDVGGSMFGVSTKELSDRNRKRGKAKFVLDIAVDPSVLLDDAWLRFDMAEKPMEAIKRIAKNAPEFRVDPVLTASKDAANLEWSAGNISYKINNPWFKSVDEPGPIKPGQTVRVDLDAVQKLPPRGWFVRPKADTVIAADTPAVSKATKILEKLDKAAKEAMDRIKKRGIGDRGPTSGATTLIDDVLDLAYYAALKAAAAGARGGQALTKIVSEAMAQVRAMGAGAAQIDEAAVRKAAKRLLRDGGGSPEGVIDAYAANREALDRRRTRNVGKLTGDTKAVKEAMAGEARARPEVSRPGERREARLLNQVQQGENRDASARSEGEQAGFRQGMEVGEKRGERKTRTSAVREIVRARRDAFKAGVAEAKATIPGLVRQLRQEQARQRQTSEIERRGAVDATKAVSEQEASIREGIRKLAQKLPMSVRGRFLTAVESAKSPLHLARAVRDMSKSLSRYEATRAARGVSKWSKPAMLKRLTNDERGIVREIARKAGQDWKTVKAQGTNADQMYAAARSLEDAYAAIRAVYKAHYAQTAKIAAIRGMTAKEAAAEAVENIEKAKKPMAASDRVEDVDANPVAKIARGFMDLRNATESVEGKHDGEGVLYRLMHRQMTWAEDAYFAEKRRRFAQVEKAVKAAGFDGLADAFEKLTGAGGRALQQTVEVVLGGATRRISVGQALSLAAIDPSTEDLIEKGMKVQMAKGRFLVPMAVTMDEVNGLRRRLRLEHPKMLEMVKAFKGIMEEMRPDVFKVHRILKGFEPEIVHDRWPLVRNLSAGEKTQTLPESSHELVNRVLENSGFLKERTGGTDAPMLVDDVLNVVFDQIDQAAKVTHIALPVRDAANVLLDSRVRTAIASRWGGKFYTDLKKMLMASSRANQVLNTPGARFVSGLNANLAVSALATNVGTYLRQIAGLTRLMPYLSAADWVHGVAGVPKVSMKAMTDASGYLWERYIGGPAGRMSPVMGEGSEAMDNPGIGRAMRQTVANVKAGDLGAAYKAWQRGGKAIMEGVNLADSVVARAAWAGFMRQAEREHPEWSGKKRAAWAAEQTADVVRETQNGSSPLDLSINSAMARDSGMAAFFLFTSDPLKARNRIARAYKKSLADGAKQTAAEAASILLGIALARGAGWAISQGVSAALGGDDRDRKRINELYFAPERILANAAREVAGDAVPILGPALTDLLTSSYNRGGSLNPPALQALNDIATAVGSIKAALMADRNKAEKFADAFEKFASAALTASGVNPFQALWRTVWNEAKHHRPR